MSHTEQPKKSDERRAMQELQRERETPDHQDPRWMHEFWDSQSDNERVRRQLGWGLR